MATKGNTVASFALEIKTADNLMRIFAEHEDQQFTISITPTKLAKEMPNRPIKPQVQFSFQDCLELAAKGFTDDPSFSDDKSARVKICGMVLYLATAIGATDIEISK